MTAKKETIYAGLFAVVVIYLTSVLVLWLLSLIGPINASIEGVIEKTGGTIWFAAAGLVAAFIIIVVIALIFIYWITRRISILAEAIRGFGSFLGRF